MAEKQGGSKCRARSSRKDAKGLNQWRKGGMPAKAGRRKPPIKRGNHVTSAHDRERGMKLAALGLSFYVRPKGWINYDLKETS